MYCNILNIISFEFLVENVTNLVSNNKLSSLHG